MRRLLNVRIAVLLIIGLTVFGCNSDKKAGSGGQVQKYTCPMHPDVISDKPGSCPKCGMDLELKENKDESDVKGDVKNDKAMDHKGCKGCMHKH